jgi:putative protease
MFNGVPQSASRLIPSLMELSVATFRVDGLFEDAATLRRKVQVYSDIIHGRASGQLGMELLGMTERFGVTEGQLYNIRGYADRKKPFTALVDLGSTGDPAIHALRTQSR